MSSLVLAAADEGEKTNNFLIPNGTFFAEVIIFLIVLGVIWFFVVPPIRKVLKERAEMVAETAADQKAAAAGFEAAQQQYVDSLKDARTEATGIRDAARAKGRENLDEMRQRATAEADAVNAETSARLQAEGERAAAEAHKDVANLSATLASRVLGFDVATDPKLSASLQTIASKQAQPSGSVN